MHRFKIYLCLMLALSSMTFGVSVEKAQESLNQALKEARAEKKSIYLQVSTNWCGWCRIMDGYLESNAVVKQKMAADYVYCKVYYDKGVKDKVLNFLPNVAAYPHVYILDCYGDLLHSQYTGALESGSSYDQEKFMKMLNDWADYQNKLKPIREQLDVTLKPMPKPDDVKPGLVCHKFTGKWEKLPDFSQLKVESSSVVKKVDAHAFNKEEYVGTQFKGFIVVPETAVYHLRLSSNDGSRLKIGDQVVLDHDGLHLLENLHRAIKLDAGCYPIEVDYFRNGGHYGLIFNLIHPDDPSLDPQFFYQEKMTERTGTAQDVTKTAI